MHRQLNSTVYALQFVGLVSALYVTVTNSRLLESFASDTALFSKILIYDMYSVCANGAVADFMMHCTMCPINKPTYYEMLLKWDKKTTYLMFMLSWYRNNLGLMCDT